MTPDDDLTRTLCNCLALRQASRHVTQFYDQALAPSGLRTTQYSLLQRVHSRGPTPVNELARQLFMDPSTLTHNLRPLLKGGLVELQVGTDRRKRVIALTKQGSAVHARARVLWLQAQARFEQAFGDARAADLRELMRSVVRTDLEGEAGDAGTEVGKRRRQAPV